MKKKIYGCLISTIAILTMVAQINAAELNISKAIQTEMGGSVSIECEITNATEDQEITVLACEEADKTYSEALIYVNQFKPEIVDNKFNFEFIPAEFTDVNKTYIVRIGGLNVDKVTSKIITLYGGNAYVVGDVNNDGKIDNADAAIVMKYIGGTAVLTEIQKKAADANSNMVIDITDAIKIIQMANS